MVHTDTDADAPLPQVVDPLVPPQTPPSTRLRQKFRRHSVTGVINPLVSHRSPPTSRSRQKLRRNSVKGVVDPPVSHQAPPSPRSWQKLRRNSVTVAETDPLMSHQAPPSPRSWQKLRRNSVTVAETDPLMSHQAPPSPRSRQKLRRKSVTGAETDPLMSHEAPPSPRSRQKLRRNSVTVAETIHDSSSVRRLVDYFVVVSCKPRWMPNRSSYRSSFSRRSSVSSENVTESREDFSEEFEAPQFQSIGTNGNINMPKAERHDHTFQPKITARYPLTDYEDNPLNPMIVQFCWDGDLVIPSTTYEMPRVHHFVLTNGKGNKNYGTCLTFFEECDSSAEGPWKRWFQTHADEEDLSHNTGIEVSMDSRKKALYLPKILCILSSWPYLTAFREYLAQLYRLASATDLMKVPIERYVVNLCMEIPAPPPGAYEIQVSILDSSIRFWAPPAKLPIAYVALPYQILFEFLDIDNILSVWTALIVERKVLLLSSQYSSLTVCAEILCSLLFPMRWSHLYVPLLPRVLNPMLDAPVPYLCGIIRENWLHAQQFVSPETIVVDLDNNKVDFGEYTPTIPPVPLKKWNKLETTLTETVGDVFWKARGLEVEYYAEMTNRKHRTRSLRVMREKLGKTKSVKWKEKLATLDHAFNLAYTPDSLNLLNDKQKEEEPSLWDCVQEAFLRFFVASFKGYQKFLIFPNTGDNPVGFTAEQLSFDGDAFIASQKLENVPFLTEVCMSQQFDDFITRRLYSPGEPDLVFFDQSIDAKLNRSKLKLKKVETPFLLSAKAHKVLKKLKAVKPNEEDLREHSGVSILKSRTYRVWPETFDESQFTVPRKIPRMIAAEFDRQSLLVSRLRSTIIEDDGDKDILEFYGGDYDPSPEVASFTVFLFAYTAVVGLHLQKYESKRVEEGIQRQLHDDAHGNSELRDGASGEIETVLNESEITDEDRHAANFCLSDLSFGLCDSCPENGIFKLKSTLHLVAEGAEEAYKELFQNVVDQIQLQINAQQVCLHKAGGTATEYEEAREVASAQLDLAFEILSIIALRGASADSDAYKSLMEACGRCGDTKRALELIELVKNDGYVADSEILSCFVAAFAREDVGGVDVVTKSNGIQDQHSCQYKGSDAYSVYLQRQFQAVKKEETKNTLYPGLAMPCLEGDNGSDNSFDDSSFSSDEPVTNPTASTTLLDWFAQNQPSTRQNTKRRRKKKRKPPSSASDMPVTEMISKQIVLGESLLDFLYPDLVIDTKSDSCPHCSNVLSENEIVSGWMPRAFQDFTTKCQKCDHRFVPRFVVTCNSPTFVGSQGNQTPLYCEFLSPWVLRKELQRVVKGGAGIEGMLKPSWRSGNDIRATLFWNLIALCRRYKLPFSFLLQGSFQSQLVLPRLPTNM